MAFTREELENNKIYQNVAGLSNCYKTVSQVIDFNNRDSFSDVEISREDVMQNPHLKAYEKEVWDDLGIDVSQEEKTKIADLYVDMYDAYNKRLEAFDRLNEIKPYEDMNALFNQFVSEGEKAIRTQQVLTDAVYQVFPEEQKAKIDYEKLKNTVGYRIAPVINETDADFKQEQVSYNLEQVNEERQTYADKFEQMSVEEKAAYYHRLVDEYMVANLLAENFRNDFEALNLDPEEIYGGEAGIYAEMSFEGFEEYKQSRDSKFEEMYALFKGSVDENRLNDAMEDFDHIHYLATIQGLDAKDFDNSYLEESLIKLDELASQAFGEEQAEKHAYTKEDALNAYDHADKMHHDYYGHDKNDRSIDWISKEELDEGLAKMTEDLKANHLEL